MRELGVSILQPLELDDWFVVLAILKRIKFLMEILSVLLLIVVMTLIVAIIVAILSVVAIVFAAIVLVSIMVALGWARVTRVPCIAMVVPRTICRFEVVVDAAAAVAVVAVASSAAIALANVALVVIVVVPRVHAAVSSAAVAALSTHTSVAATFSAVRVVGREPTFTTLVAAFLSQRCLYLL